jgi:hypothetical protein
VKCIICRLEKDASEFSDEHVIPDSLGGYYHIYTVCRPCNSSLGDAVDAPLVNHKLSELYRFVERMPGKSGAIPNPFAGTATSSEDPAVQGRAVVDEDGVLRFHLLPRVAVTEGDGVVQSIDIAVDANDERLMPDILRKKLKRLKIDEADAQAPNKLVRGELAGGFWMRMGVDTHRFKIGLLKIAYEFAVDSIDDYFEAPQAVEISRILHEADYDAVDRFATIGSGFDMTVLAPFADYLDLDSKKHFLVLTAFEEQLTCCIQLHRLFSIGIPLSARRHLAPGEMIFGVNDMEARTFRKFRFDDFMAECCGPEHRQLMYWFETAAEASEASAEIDVPGYDNELDAAGDPRLFQVDGTPARETFEDVLTRSPAQFRRDGDWFVMRLEFPDERDLFVRSGRSGSLYQIKGLEFSREQLRKL